MNTVATDSLKRDRSDAREVAIAVVWLHGKFLVGQRPGDVALGGYWEFPGGKVHVGESPTEAAIRECHEETGLIVDVTKPLATVHHRYDHGAVLLHFFLCRLLDSRSSSPHLPFVWVTREELSQLEFPPANHGVILDLPRTDEQGAM